MTAFAQAPPAKPDFTKGGPFGSPAPAATPDQKIINKANLSKTTPEAKPKILACDEQYEVDVTLTQDVKNCETFDFKKLYDQAKEMADHEIAQIQCPPEEEDCVGPKTWYGYWNWHCVDGTHAEVVVQEVAACVKAGSKVSAGYGDGAKHNKSKPASIGGPPPKEPVESGEYITVSSAGTLDGLHLDCGTKFLASYTYVVQTPDANALEALSKGNKKATEFSKVRDFKPFFDQAETKARSYHDNFKCKTSPSAKCELTKFEVFSGDIAVDGVGGTVTITLYFYVECKKA